MVHTNRLSGIVINLRFVEVLFDNYFVVIQLYTLYLPVFHLLFATMSILIFWRADPLWFMQIRILYSLKQT